MRSYRPGAADYALKANILRIQNTTLELYNTTDFDWVWDEQIIHGNRDGAGNFILIPLVRGAAYTVKYELEAPRPEYVAAALDEFELAEKLYPNWGHGWLSPSVVNFMVLAIDRLRQNVGRDATFAARLDADWQMALEILREEANGILGQMLPLAPLDSSSTGDTKAEENAWIASPLSTAAVFLPDDPNASVWEQKAREAAYASITRPSDLPYTESSVKTVTVLEDFSLNNHGFPQNAFYTAATIGLLQQAALPYLVTGRAIPAEFGHNVAGLYEKYKTYISYDEKGWPLWNVVCDEGDPTDLPVVAGDGSEYRHAALKAGSGRLWKAVEAKDTISEDELWAAIQNHKVAWRYFVNVFLPHWPSVVGTPLTR